MTIKLGRRHLFIIALCAFLWNQQVSILSQKIAIENSYQQKVSSAVSRMLGQEKFLVIVSIEFSSIGGTLKRPQPNSRKQVRLENFSPVYLQFHQSGAHSPPMAPPPKPVVKMTWKSGGLRLPSEWMKLPLPVQ